METIINFIRSEDYYLVLYIFSMLVTFFTLLGWNKSLKTGKEMLEYVNLNKQKILKFNNGENPYLEGKPLSYLIDHLIGTIKAMEKTHQDKIKIHEEYEEKQKTEIAK